MANTKSIDLERGSSQYLYISDGDQTGLDITGDFTIEEWVNIESFATGNNSLANKWGIVGQSGYQFRVVFDGSSTYGLKLIVSDDGTNFGSQGEVNWTPSTATWYHLACVYDASAGSVKFYVNGVQQGTTQTGLPTSVFNNNQPFVIGVNYNGGSMAQFWDGKIDEVRVWSDIRTGAEILANYKKQLVGNEANLVGYWRFNDSLLDITSNNNDLSAPNGSAYSTDIPDWAGKGKSFSQII